MPIFTYECRKCEHRIERFVANATPPLSFQCPKCKAWTDKKVPSVPAKAVVRMSLLSDMSALP